MDVSKMDLDYLIYGNPTSEEICAFFARGEFIEGKYLVDAIERHLVTDANWKTIGEHHLCVDKMLSGHYPVSKDEVVQELLRQWNEKLGFDCFGG